MKCPNCGDEADTEIDDSIPVQFIECDECEEEYQITWDATAKTATVEVLPDEDDEDDDDLTDLGTIDADDEEDDFEQG